MQYEALPTLQNLQIRQRKQKHGDVKPTAQLCTTHQWKGWSIGSIIFKCTKNRVFCAVYWLLSGYNGSSIFFNNIFFKWYFIHPTKCLKALSSKLCSLSCEKEAVFNHVSGKYLLVTLIFLKRLNHFLLKNITLVSKSISLMFPTILSYYLSSDLSNRHIH